ncbi:hypothetical protein N7517_004472 [Penicillium concentricum]|uniref:Uncharacterized protein n=1 Tax=Penicillium concentricum TaxID=293559 RepID=A0A9W9S5N9_9EURO|nr:uncharacterized protein N7517_004472 [Penicillium concentricum]KAJ5372466.1 hypothetical protein N7517_004472 [Penicillium concentricum]
MYQQSKARRDILSPQYHRPEVRQKTDGHDHHHLCHVQQLTRYSRDNHLHLIENRSDTIEPQLYNLQQAPRPKETVHCYFCPHFRGQDPNLKMNNVEFNLRVHRHKICYHNRYETQYIHHQPRIRPPKWNENEEHNYHIGHYYTQEIHSNEQQDHAPTVKHFHEKGSNDPFDRVHHNAAPPDQGTCAGITMCKSHEDGCGSNIKAVRFEEDARMPEYTETRDSNCPIHRTPPLVEDQCYSRRNPRHRQTQSRESRTYRWAWGPPLPAVVTRRGKIYYAENY